MKTESPSKQKTKTLDIIVPMLLCKNGSKDARSGNKVRERSHFNAKNWNKFSPVKKVATQVFSGSKLPRRQSHTEFGGRDCNQMRGEK